MSRLHYEYVSLPLGSSWASTDRYRVYVVDGSLLNVYIRWRVADLPVASMACILCLIGSYDILIR